MCLRKRSCFYIQHQQNISVGYSRAIFLIYCPYLHYCISYSSALTATHLGPVLNGKGTFSLRAGWLSQQDGKYHSR